jgi:hypothetical protein
MILMLYFAFWCVMFWAIALRPAEASGAVEECPPSRVTAPSISVIQDVSWDGDAPSPEILLRFAEEIPTVEDARAAQYDAIARKRKLAASRPKSPAEAARAARAVQRGPLQCRAEPASAVTLDVPQARIDDAIALLSREEDRVEAHDPTL